MIPWISGLLFFSFKLWIAYSIQNILNSNHKLFFSFKDDLFFDKNYGSKCSLDYCILLSCCQELSILLLPLIHLNLFKSLYQYFLLVIFFFAYPFPKSILASDMLLKSFGFDTGKQYEFNVYNFEAEMIIWICSFSGLCVFFVVIPLNH